MTALRSGRRATSAASLRRGGAPGPLRLRPACHLGAALLLAAAIPEDRAIAAMSVEKAPSQTCAPAIGPAQARLAAALIGRLAKSGRPDNIVVSPASLAGAFGTLSLGADAAMEKAMASSLGFAPDAVCTPRALFEALDKSVDDLAKGAADSVRAADRLILDPATKPYPLLLSTLADHGRQIVVDDLARPDGVARANDWVREKTRGLIPTILNGPLERPALTVLDALHFKASWAKRFDPALTKAHPFRGADGRSEDVLLMHLGEGKYAIRRNEVFVAADLPFAGERISLLLVTTTGKPATASDFAKAAPFLDGTGYAMLSGEVALPRLKLSAAGNLLPALPEVEKAGRGTYALGGFAPGIRLGQILQRVEMSADETGAEAAAATAVTTTRSFEGQPIQVVLDKPFLFALRDRATGLVLVAGYVGKPGVPPGLPEAAKAAAGKPDAAAVGAGASDGAKRLDEKPDAGPPGAGKADAGKAESDRPAVAGPTAGKAEADSSKAPAGRGGNLTTVAPHPSPEGK